MPGVLSYWTTTEAPVLTSTYTAPTGGFPDGSVGLVKNPPAMQEAQV